MFRNKIYYLSHIQIIWPPKYKNFSETHSIKLIDVKALLKTSTLFLHQLPRVSCIWSSPSYLWWKRHSYAAE